MRSLAILRWALPALLLLTPDSPIQATTATPTIYACFGAGTQKIDPRANGCPANAPVSLLASLSLGGSDITQVGATNRVSFANINLAKSHDANSEMLLSAAEKSTALPVVAIAVYEPGIKTPAYNILLTTVDVTSWQWSASTATTSTTATVAENLSLTPHKFTLVDNATGQVVTWNLLTNSPNNAQ